MSNHNLWKYFIFLCNIRSQIKRIKKETFDFKHMTAEHFLKVLIYWKCLFQKKIFKVRKFTKLILIMIPFNFRENISV